MFFFLFLAQNLFHCMLTTLNYMLKIFIFGNLIAIGTGLNRNRGHILEALNGLSFSRKPVKIFDR